MVGERDLLSRLLVELRGQALRELAAVHEHHGGAMGADERHDPWVDGGPDAAARRRPGGITARDLVEGLSETPHVLDGHFHGEIEGSPSSGVDDLDGPRNPAARGATAKSASVTSALAAAGAPGLAVGVTPEIVADLPPGRRQRDVVLRSARGHLLRPAGFFLRPSAEQARDLVERTLRRGESDPLERLPRRPQRFQPLQGEEEVGAALGRHERVDLVDDDGLDAAQRLPPLRGEQEVERLRRRDEDVRGTPEHLRALVLRGVAGADPDFDVPVALARAVRLGADPGDGRPQVALDVDAEGLERGDTYTTLRPGPWAPNITRSIAERNAASVLPDPVGASSKVERPSAMGLRPRRCAWVGPPNAARNHARTGSLKRARTSSESAGGAPETISPVPDREVPSHRAASHRAASREAASSAQVCRARAPRSSRCAGCPRRRAPARPRGCRSG
jgi:hypothetical protein